MLVQWIAAFVLPAVLALLITPLVMRVAIRMDAMDRPNERKAHIEPKPRLGGVAVFASFVISVNLFLILDPFVPFPAWAQGTQGAFLALAGAVVLGLGIWDDLHALKPSHKFLVQLLISSALYLGGFRIDAVTHLFGEGVVNLGIFNYLFTVTWMIGVTNAINLIDGLDGLAAGVSAIAAASVVAISIIQGDLGTGFLGLMLCGAILGFLHYNFNPAKIFMGDSGSLFIGLSLAVLSSQSYTKSSTAFSLLVPVLALGLPIMDTLLSMVRRLLNSFLAEGSTQGGIVNRLSQLFHPDRGHIHHRLMALGFTHRKAVLVLYTVSSLLGVVAFLVTVINNVTGSLVLIVVGVATVAGVRMLQYREMAVFRNGILLPLFDRQILEHHRFQAFLDTAFILLAYAGAYLLTQLTFGRSSVNHELAIPLTVVGIVQFVVFYGMGCYRGTLRQFGLVDALEITRAAAIGVILSGAVILLLTGSTYQCSPTILALDFYFVLTLTLGSRLSFRVLKYLFEVSTVRGDRVVIYGANAEGTFILQRILDQQFPNLTPVGFLDDRPQLQGKQVHGFPVLGDCLDLDRLASRFELDEVLISTPDLTPEVFQKLRDTTSSLGLRLRAFQMELVPVSTTDGGYTSHDPHDGAGGVRMRTLTPRERLAS